MFSKLTSILTTTAMLLHAVLGCCTHHAHACEHGQSAEECQVEHDEHHSDEAEIAHSGEHGESHAGCSSHGHEMTNVCRDSADGTQIASPESHVPSQHPHEPCQQNCDGGDCSFTQSHAVKTPSLDEGRLRCPAVCVLALSTIFVGNASVCRESDAGPPDALATACCRPMTQVWRL